MMNLFSIIFYLSSIVSIGTGIFSKIIINVLYGADFSDAAEVLVIVVWHTLLSFLAAGRDIWILANNKQAILVKINIIGALLNVALNLIFINQYGVIGAAWASLISRIFVYIVLGSVLKPISGCTKIMLRALNPKNALDLLKDIKDRGVRING